MFLLHDKRKKVKNCFIAAEASLFFLPQHPAGLRTELYFSKE